MSGKTVWVVLCEDNTPQVFSRLKDMAEEVDGYAGLRGLVDQSTRARVTVDYILAYFRQAKPLHLYVCYETADGRDDYLLKIVKCEVISYSRRRKS